MDDDSYYGQIKTGSPVALAVPLIHFGLIKYKYFQNKKQFIKSKEIQTNKLKSTYFKIILYNYTFTFPCLSILNLSIPSGQETLASFWA